MSGHEKFVLVLVGIIAAAALGHCAIVFLSKLFLAVR